MWWTGAERRVGADGWKRTQERAEWGVQRTLGGGTVGSWVESSGGGASQHSLKWPSGWWFKKGKAWLRKLTRLAHGVPTLFLWRNIYIN